MKAALLRFARDSYNEREETNRMATISPTPIDTIDIIVKDLEYKLVNDVLYICDIGCGDGRWLTAFADKYQCVCLGLEIEEERLLKAKQTLNERDCCMKGIVEFVHADFLHHSLDLKKLDIVIIYLSRKGNAAVKQKLEQECKSGTIIIAIGFQLKDWAFTKKYDRMPPAFIYAR